MPEPTDPDRNPEVANPPVDTTSDPVASDRERGNVQGTADKFILFISSSWIRTVLELVVGLVLTPLLLGSIGIVLFGLYILISHFTMAMVMPIRVALTQMLVKSMTKATASGDDRQVSQQFTNIVAIALAAGMVFVLVGFTASLFAPTIIEYPGHLHLHVKAIFITEACIIGLLVMRGPWLALFMVEHRPLSFNFDTLLTRWIDLFAFGIAVIPVGWDTFLAFIFLRLGFIAVHCFIRVLLGRRLIPAARVRLRLLSRSVIKSLTSTGALATAQPFNGFAFDILDHYLLNLAFGPVYNAIYAVVNTLRGFARRFGAGASVGTEAISSDMYEKGRHDSIVRSLLGTMRLVSGTLLICSGFVALFFGPIVDVWLGSRLSQDPELLAIMTYEEAIDLAWIFVLLLLLGGVLMEVSIAGSRFLYGMGMIGKYSGVLFAAGISKILIAVSAIVLLMSPWELQFMPDKESIEATLLLPGSTLLCQLVFFGFLFPRKLIRLAEIPLGQYLSQVWLRPIAAVLPPLGIGAIFIFVIESWTIWHLGLTCIGVGLLFIPMILFVLLTSSERAQVLRVARRGFSLIRTKLTRRPNVT